MARWVKTTGEIIEVTPQKGKKFKLEELQRFVGGYIERVQLPDRLDMIVNEEGRIHNLPFNQEASRIAARLICGDALITRRGEW